MPSHNGTFVVASSAQYFFGAPSKTTIYSNLEVSEEFIDSLALLISIFLSNHTAAMFLYTCVDMKLQVGLISMYIYIYIYML